MVMKINIPKYAQFPIMFCSLVLFACVFATYLKYKDAKSITYQVTCVDDILTGIVTKKGDRYYRRDGIEPVWIPMQQCALEPIK